MFNIGFLWLALSIGSEITGTSMIKKPMASANWRLLFWLYALMDYVTSR
jgi:hypothetical protein